jgi:hypothetical protein
MTAHRRAHTRDYESRLPGTNGIGTRWMNMRAAGKKKYLALAIPEPSFRFFVWTVGALSTLMIAVATFLSLS